MIAYRDIADTDAMIEAATTHKHAVVIGGGLLGLEAANGLMLRGMDVTVVHSCRWLMERQLDDVAGKLLQKSLEDRGLKFLLGAQTAGARRRRATAACAAVRFKDGTRGPGRPGRDGRRHPPEHRAGREGAACTATAASSSTTRMQTVPTRASTRSANASAHRGIAYGLVAPLFEQAKVCANHLAQFGIGRYAGSLTSTKLKVTGIDLFSAGDFMGGEGTEEIVLSRSRSAASTRSS